MTNIHFLKNKFAKDFEKINIKSRGNGVYEISNRVLEDGDIELEDTIFVKILNKYSDFKKFDHFKAFDQYHFVFKEFGE